MITVNGGKPEKAFRQVSKKVRAAFDEIKAAQFAAAFQLYGLQLMILRRDYIGSGANRLSKGGKVLGPEEGASGANIVTIRKSRAGRPKEDIWTRASQGRKLTFHTRPNRAKPAPHQYWAKNIIFTRGKHWDKNLTAPTTSDVDPSVKEISRTSGDVTFKMTYDQSRRVFIYRMHINGASGRTLRLLGDKKGMKSREIIVRTKSELDKEAKMRGRPVLWLAMSKAMTQWENLHEVRIRQATKKIQKKWDSPT